VQSVKSDFEDQTVKTETQAVRKEHEAEVKARELSKRASEAVSDTKKTNTKGEEAKSKAKAYHKRLQDNSDNPVVIGNAVILVAGTAALTFGAYKKHSEGQLDWKLARTVAGIVGVFSIADYFTSK